MFPRVLLLMTMSILPLSILSAQTDSGVEGVINVSPAHGGPSRIGVPDSRPLANTEFVVTKDGASAGSFTTDAEGKFRVSLGAGHYSIARKGAPKAIGRCGPFEVDVVAGQFSKVEWMCDSGMR